MRLELLLPRSRGPRLLEDCGDDTVGGGGGGAEGVTLLTCVCLLAYFWLGASFLLSLPHPHPRMALLVQGTPGVEGSGMGSGKLGVGCWALGEP